MIKRNDFLKKYNISESSFGETGLEWKQLEAIYVAYEKIVSTLELDLMTFAERLQRAPKVHSIKTRIKAPEHLIEKIIREKRNTPSLEITVDNYDTVINDLIGLRALHLFKADWEFIHDWIMESWELKGKPVVNIREGDQPELVKLFEKKGCDIKKHPFGYRSAHYIVASKPSKKEVIAEIQVRTIFEEGWSEIDHLIRYPYVKDNSILEQYLVIFNRFAGSADEMGSYIRYLDTTLKIRDSEFRKTIEGKSKKNKELQEKISELENKIEKIKMEHEDRATLKLGLEQISDITTEIPDFSKFAAPTIDFSNLVSPPVDFSKFAALTIDFSNLVSPPVDFSKFAAPTIDLSNIAPPPTDLANFTQQPTDIHHTSPPIIDLSNESEIAKNGQESQISEEEEEINNGEHKKKEQEKQEEEERE